MKRRKHAARPPKTGGGAFRQGRRQVGPGSTGISPEDIATPSELELIHTGQRHGIAPDSAKCMVFCWLDKGLPWSVVRFLAKRHLKLTAASLSSYGAVYRKQRGVHSGLRMDSE